MVVLMNIFQEMQLGRGWPQEQNLRRAGQRMGQIFEIPPLFLLIMALRIVGIRMPGDFVGCQQRRLVEVACLDTENTGFLLIEPNRAVIFHSMCIALIAALPTHLEEYTDPMGHSDESEPKIVTLRVAIVPSSSSNDHAVQLFADDQEVIRGGLGLDPDDFFGNAVAVATDEARAARMGRCDCGCVGCGDIEIRIARQGGLVVWDQDGNQLHFDGAQYDAELARAEADRSWEPRVRTAERLVRERLNRRALTRAGLVFEWASGRARPRLFTLSLRATKEPGRQILLEVPYAETDDTERVVASVLAALAERARDN